MNVNIKSKNGITLKTANSYCNYDIIVTLDESLFNITTEETTFIPTKEVQIYTPTNDTYISKVTINAIPNEYIIPSGTLTITENGTYNVNDYADAIVDVQTGTNTTDATAVANDIRLGKTAYNADGKITGTIPTYGGNYIDGEEIVEGILENILLNKFTVLDSGVTSVKQYTFYGATALTKVNLPLAKTIGAYSFSGCSSLTDVYIPNATSVGDQAFRNCTSLVSLSMPKATTLSGYLVSGCSSLTELNAPNATSGKGFAIAGTKIEHLYLPSFTSPGSSVFRGATYLKTVDMPVLNKLEQYLFMGCTALETLTLPKVYSANDLACEGCTSLYKVDLPICKSISAKAFYNCSQLETLILRLTTANCTLANVNALTGTKIADGTGYIYVPREKVDTLKSATNWSTYANQFRAIEDYPEICGGTV